MLPIDQYVFTSTEYKMVANFYGNRCAERSKVPLINHIHEGLLVLENINAPLMAKLAYCMHPLVQADADLYNYYFEYHDDVSQHVMILAMEYRNIANRYLSHRKIASIDEVKLSPLPNVNLMLCADKIQNYKDFIIYHKDTHPRSAELDEYFNNWLKVLDINDFDWWFDQLQRVN